MTGNERNLVLISAYELEVIQTSFTNTLRWTEHYMDKSGYSGNWQKQTEPIKRQDLNDQPTEIKGFMETALLALNVVVKDKPDFINENLQEQFYSWLDKSGIRSDNCPKDLSDCLTNIHKVLTNDGKDFAERVDREADEDIARMSPEERRQNFHNTFINAQKLMPDAEARKQNLKGKTYKDVEMTNPFSGNPDRGKAIFNQIKNNKEISGQLTNDGAVINGEDYEEIPVNSIRVTQEQVDAVNQKQRELAQIGTNAKVWIPVGIGGGFVALITVLGVRVFKPSMR